MIPKKIIAIDFDGTIVEDSYPEIGRLKNEAKEAIDRIYGNINHYVIINTCRAGDQLIEMINFLIEKQIPFHRVNDNAPWLIEKYGNTRKIHADVFIDANNLGGLPDWDMMPSMIDKNLPF